MENTTQDPVRPRLPQGAGAEEEALLVVLHHGDLSMVGQVFRLTAGEPLVVGREGPRFQAPWASQEARALADPCISRKQLRIRWHANERTLHVEALPEARRSLRCFGASGEPLSSGEPLCSGGSLAIGDRVLLGFVVRPGINLDLAGGLVGESEPFAELCQQIAAAALCDDTVVVRGEASGGVELAARAVHQASSRRTTTLRVVRAQDLDERALLSEIEAGAEIPLLIEGSDRVSPTAQVKLFQKLSELLSRLRFGATRGSLRLYLTQRPDASPPLAEPLVLVDVPPLHERSLDVPLLFVQALRRRLLFQEQSAGARSWLMAALWRAADTQDGPLPMDFFLSLIRHPWPGQLPEVEALAAALVQGSLQARKIVLPQLVVPPAAPAPPSLRRGAADPGGAPLPGVTPQQQRVLEALREGQTSKEIGNLLGCSPRTVEAHIAQLMRKTSTRSRAQLVAWAFKNDR